MSHTTEDAQLADDYRSVQLLKLRYLRARNQGHTEAPSFTVWLRTEYTDQKEPYETE